VQSVERRRRASARYSDAYSRLEVRSATSLFEACSYRCWNTRHASRRPPLLLFQASAHSSAAAQRPALGHFVRKGGFAKPKTVLRARTVEAVAGPRNHGQSLFVPRCSCSNRTARSPTTSSSISSGAGRCGFRARGHELGSRPQARRHRLRPRQPGFK
jgi:hypothetical protein